MPDEHFDAVVIGAGLGGLTAAAYLARAGKRVLVLEHHSVPGGYAHEFKRAGFRFEVSLHAIDGVAPGGWSYPILDELDVLNKVDFRRLDPFYTAKFPDHQLDVHSDPLAYEAELIRNFPDEAAGIRSLIDSMTKVFTETRRFWIDGEEGVRPPLEQMPSRYPQMLKAMNQSWANFMDEHLTDPQARAVISTLWGYFGLPPSKLNAATFILPWVSYHYFGAFYPVGGSMAMSRALAVDITDHGGEIRYRQTVTDIEIRDGRADAVSTAKGLRVEAGIIVSNANAPDTLLEMIGREHLPADYSKGIEETAPSLSNLVVYLGLDTDLGADGWPHHEYYQVNTYDLEADHHDSVSGNFDKTSMVMTHYSHVDDVAPDGQSVLSLFSIAPWEHAEQWGTNGNVEDYSTNPAYIKAKELAGDALVARAEALLPGLRDKIVVKEIATPLTNLRYSLNRNGAIYGSEQSVDNMYVARLDRRTPIENVFLAGAWTFGGGQSAALLSGRTTARTVLAYLNGTADPDPAIPLVYDHSEVDTEVVPGMPGNTSTSGTLFSTPVTAIETGRSLTLNQVGHPLVLLFHTQDTASSAQSINESIRKHHPDPNVITVVNIVDLHAVPRMFRKIAERAMRSSFNEAAASLDSSFNPDECIVIVADWDGSITKAMGFENVDDVPGIAILDAKGDIAQTEQSADPATTLAFLTTILE